MSWKESVDRDEKLKKLFRETENRYGSGAYFDERKNRIIKYSSSDKSKYPSYLKKFSSKKLRRYYKTDSEELLQRGKYRKVFDYYWHLF